MGQEATDAGAALTAAIINYRQAYEDSLKDAPDDEAERAKALVQKARKIVRESGLSRALVHVLLDEVKYWASWSKGPKFREYVHFDAQDVVASNTDLGNSKRETRVAFTYNGSRYELVFYDEGWSNFGEPFHHGRVEFQSGGQIVLGLNIADDMDPDCSQWDDFDLYAFRLGEWTKALLKIAVDTEAHWQRSDSSRQNAEAVEKARNIEI